MRKYQWLVIVMLIGCIVAFAGCRRMEQMIAPVMPDAEMIEPPPEMVEPEPPEEMMETPVDLVDVLIYTNRSYWIELEAAEMAAETTKNLLEANGVSVHITKDDTYVREWMLQTTSDGNLNVIVFYGVLPASVYPTGNAQTDGSIAENWIETTDGDTILNHADYIAYNTDYDTDKIDVDAIVDWDDQVQAVGSNRGGGLQNLMDNPTINLFTAGVSSMKVTSDGFTLTPSLANFDSLRPIPLAQLQGEWFAEKVFASDTGNAEATYADPVILRDGDLGRLAIVHATTEYEGLLNGKVAAEIILNSLLASPTMPAAETTPETVETPAETPPMVDMEPAETTDLLGGMVDIEDAMSTVGLRKVYWPDGWSIMRGNPDGSGIETIVNFANPPASMWNLVVDSEGNKIYWNSYRDNPQAGLWRANLDGTNVEHIVTTRVRNFTLDLESRKIYWISEETIWTLEDTDHLFHRSNLDGSDVEKFKTSTVQTLFGDLGGIAFDPIDRKIYTFNREKMFVINADDLDIKFADIEFEWQFPDRDQKRNSALDIENRKIYWLNYRREIYRANLDGTNHEQILPVAGGQLDTHNFTLDFNTRKIYWQDLDRKIFWQANLDGSMPEALFAVGYGVLHIAVESGPIN